MDLTLYYMTHSPWSMKARAALRHHRLAVRELEYRPMLDEPGLRLRLARTGGPRWGKVSVPVLFTPEGPLCDSWDIALFADRMGEGAALIPDTQAAQAWNQRCERLMNAGRARFLARVMENQDAQREMVPSMVASMPAPVLRFSMTMFNAKYGIRTRDFDMHGKVMEAELDALQTALSDGRDYVLGSFSIADIALGIGLQVLKPIPGSAFGPNAEPLAAEPELCERYADLLRWRDMLQQKHTLIVV